MPRQRFDAPETLSPELRMAWDSGDAWGSCMGLLFDVAAELYWRGEGPPDAWEYRPGAAGGDPREKDSYTAGCCEDAATSDLLSWGEALRELREEIIAAGLDY